MPRSSVTSELRAAIKRATTGDRETLKWLIMLRIDLPSGGVYAHTGVGPLSWDGKTWLGVGNLARIGGISENIDGGDDRITVALTGLPQETFPDFVDIFTLEDTANSPWFMYFGLLDDDGLTLDGDAIEINSGITGGADMVDGPERAIAESLVTEAALGRNTVFTRSTNEDHQNIFPGDKFFEFKTDLQKEIRWGSADPKQISNDVGAGDGLQITRSFDR